MIRKVKLATLVANFLSFILAGSCVQANDNTGVLHLWDKNFDSVQTRAFLQLALDKAAPEYGKYTLVSVPADDVLQAIDNMKTRSGMDLLVSGVNRQWESELLPVFVPLERGLLGFRVCLTNKSSVDALKQIEIPADFSRFELKVAVGTNWPDRTIMTNNQIKVSHAAAYVDILSMLSEGQVDCFSRSVIEVAQEQAQHPQFEIDKHLGFVYPLADLIYVRPGAESIRDMFRHGLEIAIEDGSYRRLFNTFYHNTLMEQDFYSRKLLIMANPEISEKAREAINQYGIASFSKRIR